MPQIRELGTREGVLIRGFEIEYETDKENWSQYTLADGTRVRAKFSVVKMFRLVDEKDQPAFDLNGDPDVFVSGGIIVVASKRE
jgi:hypothetical protein